MTHKEPILLAFINPDSSLTGRIPNKRLIKRYWLPLPHDGFFRGCLLFHRVHRTPGHGVEWRNQAFSLIERGDLSSTGQLCTHSTCQLETFCTAPFEGLTPQGSKRTVARLRSSLAYPTRLGSFSRVSKGADNDSSYNESASDLALSQLLTNLRDERMGEIMTQFCRTMLTVMGLAVAAAVLSSIPAQAASVVNHGFVPSGGFFTLLDPNNPASTELVTFQVVNTGNSDMFFYTIFDFGGGFSAAGSGSIPASSVNVSGGSVNTGNVTVRLNVNTCNVPGFTNLGPCGTFVVTWVEMPASIGGSTVSRGDFQQTIPNLGTTVMNGQTETFFALMSGTAFGFEIPTSTIGFLQKLTNVTVTFPAP